MKCSKTTIIWSRGLDVKSGEEYENHSVPVPTLFTIQSIKISYFKK